MPTYKELTNEEKKQILQLHNTYVESINETLENKRETAEVDGMEFTATNVEKDEHLSEKLNNQGTLAIYRTSQEMHKLWEKEQAIMTKLKDIRTPNLDDGIWLKHLFKTEDTPEALEYNRKLYEQYMNNPAKFFAVQMRRVLEFNPTEMIKLKDDPVALMEYYKEHREILDLAAEFHEYTKPENYDDLKTYLSPDLKKALNEGARDMLEAISYPARLAKVGNKLEFLALPKLDKDQAKALGNYRPQELKEIIRAYRNGLEDKKPCDLFTRAQYDQYTMGAGTLANYKITKYDDGQIKNLEKRNRNETLRIKTINDEFLNEYRTQWAKRFNTAMGYNDGDHLNMDKVVSDHKGGVFERFGNWFKGLFGGQSLTADQYKDFIQAFKDYHNPQSPNYMNDINLRTKGNAYLDYKREQYPNPQAMSGTSLKRFNFITRTIDLLNRGNEIAQGADQAIKEAMPIYKINLPQEIKKDLEDNIIDNNQLEIEVEKINDMDNEIIHNNN